MRYHNILKENMLNGDGIRAVLFVSGCPHHCLKCQNPITWNKNGGLSFDAEAKAELFAELEKDYVSGITFSGGDPMATYNRDEVLALIDEIKDKFPNKTVWVYSGYTKTELEEQGFWNKLSDKIDVFVEGKFEIAHRSVSYNWAGSTNQRVLRKESGFLLNTSDPLYVSLQSVLNSVKFAPRVIKEFISGKVDELNRIEQSVTESSKTVPELLDELSNVDVHDFPCVFDSEMYESFIYAVENTRCSYKKILQEKQADAELECALHDFSIYEQNNHDDPDLPSKLFDIKQEIAEKFNISDERFDNWCIALSIKTKPELTYSENADLERG